MGAKEILRSPYGELRMTFVLLCVPTEDGMRMPRFKKISAVLLCGGKSERLGFPKEMLRVDGAPLAVQMVRRLKALFDKVALSTPDGSYLRHLVEGVPIIEDEHRDAGPMGGIVTGLKHADTGKVFFLACDMPLVHNDIIGAVVNEARRADAEAVCARVGGVMQPLCAVYSASLVPVLEQMLLGEGNRYVVRLLDRVKTRCVDFSGPDAARLRDVDTSEDLPLLRQAFSDVEPLPVRLVGVKRVGGLPIERDVVVEEWPVAVFANGVKLATVLCMPTGIRELVVGFAAYLGLVERREQVRSIEVDYEAKRAALELDVEDARIKSAVQLLVTSTCGANVYGPRLPDLHPLDGDGGFRVTRSHLLECVSSLRSMAPVFSRTGCTHQAAFSDGQGIRILYEDIGRHNAMDKVVGHALMQGVDMSRGALVTTGRLNAEMVVKALRRSVPVLASRSAVSTHAVQLAETYGLTLVGFARNARVNVYTRPERVEDE